MAQILTGFDLTTKNVSAGKAKGALITARRTWPHME